MTMAKTLFTLNDAPCGTRRRFNVVRLAGSRSISLEEISSWTRWADKALVF